MVFCGATQTKIPFGLAAELQPLGPDAEYIRIQGTSRNALDYHIDYYIVPAANASTSARRTHTTPNTKLRKMINGPSTNR